VNEWREVCAWPDSLALFQSLGGAVVKRRADAGDREAQFTHGIMLMSEANGGEGHLGAPATSPKAQVGLDLGT